ncbi:MAG: DUF2062 domain-containing protein [Kiloniellales bacterium]
MLRRLESFVGDRRYKARWPWRLARLIYYQLVLPIKRDQNSSAVIARGTMVGTVVGFTPTVGVQMLLTFIIWWIARTLFRWQFSLALALGWTWVSNPVTMIPLYYTYYVAGALALNQSLEFLPFDKFRNDIVGRDAALATDWLNRSLDVVVQIWNALGAEIIVGSAILAPVAGVVSYMLAVRVVRFYVKHRRRPRWQR